jgi:hypothetical protein
LQQRLDCLILWCIDRLGIGGGLAEISSKRPAAADASRRVGSTLHTTCADGDQQRRWREQFLRNPHFIIPSGCNTLARAG